MDLIRWGCGAGLLAILLPLLPGIPAAASAQGTDRGEWHYYGGEKAFTRYSPLDQIDRENVQDLEILWRRPGADPSLLEELPGFRPPAYLKSTPSMIEGILYASNALGLVEAFHPGTGETIWVQQPFEPGELAGQSTRGLDYWADGDDRRLLSVRGEYLYALDLDTGEPLPDFGEGGRVNLTPAHADRFNWTSGPIVVNDVVVIGGTLDGAGDSGFRWKDRPPEDMRGYDVRSGRQLWTFHVVPREGEFGVETWGEESWRRSGDLGSWCCLSGDEELGHVYVPLSAPTAAYYGGHRPGDNLFSNSLVALDVGTGERMWHFQMVRHDLWEYDNQGPPILGEITVDGRRIRAVMQPSKTAFLYVFDRETGEPVWPIEDRPVPPSTVPGEEAAPTQPFPTKPPPFDRQGMTEDDLIDLTPDLRERALALADSFVLGPIFTPPTLMEEGGKQGTLTFPGSWGGGNWHTGAFDPETGIYYAVSHTTPRVYRLEKATDPEAEMEYWSPNREAPYIDGLPIVKPPWGRITALDLNRGEEVWMAANGDGPRDHPLLEGLDLPPLGVASRPVPLVTKTLLFLGEGSDVISGIIPGTSGHAFRAYDKATGERIWAMDLPAGTTGGPMTYLHEGRQYIVVPVGDRGGAPEWVALGLP